MKLLQQCLKNPALVPKAELYSILQWLVKKVDWDELMEGMAKLPNLTWKKGKIEYYRTLRC